MVSGNVFWVDVNISAVVWLFLVLMNGALIILDIL